MFEGLGINGSCLCWIDDYTMESWLIASFERDFSLDFEYLLYLDEEWWLFDFDFSLGFGSASLIILNTFETKLFLGIFLFRIFYWAAGDILDGWLEINGWDLSLS